MEVGPAIYLPHNYYKSIYNFIDACYFQLIEHLAEFPLRRYKMQHICNELSRRYKSITKA